MAKKSSIPEHVKTNIIYNNQKTICLYIHNNKKIKNKKK